MGGSATGNQPDPPHRLTATHLPASRCVTRIRTLPTVTSGLLAVSPGTWPTVAASLSLVALALGLAWWLGLRVERDLVVAAVRAAVQLLVVGAVFVAIFESGRALLWAWVWVVGMVIVATAVVRRRAPSGIPNLTLAVTAAVAASAAISIVVTFGLGVIDLAPVSLVVVAGITIGNAVPSAALAANLSVEACRDRVAEIEAALALGFDRRESTRLLAARTARSALIPQVDRTKVVGLIALPGAMTGLLLAGVDPIDAVVIQLLVMYLVLGAAAVCVVTVVATITHGAVTPSLQAASWTRDRETG